MKRFSYRVPASLQLFSDDRNAPERILHTRKVNPRGAVFVSSSQIPVGHAGIARLPSPTGSTVEVHCLVSRCRLLAPNRYAGSLCFIRDLDVFSEYSLTSPSLCAA